MCSLQKSGPQIVKPHGLLPPLLLVASYLGRDRRAKRLQTPGRQSHQHAGTLRTSLNGFGNCGLNLPNTPFQVNCTNPGYAHTMVMLVEASECSLASNVDV